jgi:hypothetical protein
MILFASNELDYGDHHEGSIAISFVHKALQAIGIITTSTLYAFPLILNQGSG